MFDIQIELKNMLSISVEEWLVILVGFSMWGSKKNEPRVLIKSSVRGCLSFYAHCCQGKFPAPAFSDSPAVTCWPSERWNLYRHADSVMH